MMLLKHLDLQHKICFFNVTNLFPIIASNEYFLNYPCIHVTILWPQVYLGGEQVIAQDFKGNTLSLQEWCLLQAIFPSLCQTGSKH